MAAPNPTGGAGEALPMPSRNPLPLSASQEAQIRDIYYARVRTACAPEIKGDPSILADRSPRTTAFADCALNRTFTVSFVCREQLRAMNGCMKAHATPVEHDAAREEWFAKRLERQKERERKAVKKAQQEDFIREWWGLPEKDAETRRKEEEKMRQAERVGGYAARDRKRWEEEQAAAEKR
ncbi:cytochrome c oxidase biogenesis protein [Colletotrichum sojae]|uniref:COX assembly mitochondrial protein n=1 Tax=Colletotrichum sojae TaxID=2175907 RepID=A0A8H6N615_9PEZI|nr:cytochrome c oxidase biogenesis protein [Colletotrichum sojae]